MLSRKSNLPAIRSSTALKVAGESSAAIVAPGQVPKEVVKGIKGIMLAFPSQGLADSDQAIVQEQYLEAVSGFPRAIVDWTLRFLVFNNPRNTATFTTRPTPQDVREACKQTRSDWWHGVHRFYFDPPYGARFIVPSERAFTDKALMARFEAAHYSGRPGEPDCLIPEDLQIAFLQEAINRQIQEIERQAAQEKRGEIPSDSSTAALLVMPDDAFERLPREAFPNESRDAILAMRRERVERARKREEHEAYLKSLPDLVRRVRWIVFRSDISHGWSEEQIMAETKLRLAKIQREKAECEAARAVYVGTGFDDGSEFVELPADRRRAAFEAAPMSDEEFEKRKAEMIEQLRKDGFDI